MKHLTTFLASVIALSFVLAGCKKDEAATSKSDEPAKVEPKAETQADKTETPAKTEEPKPAELSVDELESLLDQEKVAVYDANGDKVREKFGKIPGAKLLSGNDWKLEELPSNKSEKLVFYCSNRMCGAAPGAAKKAIVAGYSDVNVLPVGIKGWTEAGKKTETVQ